MSAFEKKVSLTGTEGSNPSPSSRESHANLSIEGKPAFREAFQRRRCLVPG